jgi:hypothetical protein
MPMNPRLLRPLSGFNPKQFAGLKIWYDAANTGAVALSGSAVSQINDLSGNGFHATQGVANDQPAYESAGINSRPAINHDNSDTLKASATPANLVANASTSPEITLFVVCSSTSPNAGLAVGCDPVANGRLVVYFPFDNSATNAFWDVAGTGGGRLSFPISTANRAAGIYCCQRNGASMLVRRNGVELASKANASQTFSSPNSTFGIGQISFASGFSGRWSHLLCYSAALSLSQIQAVERYLASRAGITL